MRSATLLVAATLALFAPVGAQEVSTEQPGPDAPGNVTIAPALFHDLKFRMVGPTRGGRVTAVHGVPQEPGTYYMGATGGGMWKTTDFGQTWKPLGDGVFETPSIGAIDVNESNPAIIYVGTGSQGIRSNVIAGRGMYKSTDAGETWEFLGLRTTGQIGAVETHPQNPDLVYVAALGSPSGPNPDRGVYRSKDGGHTWEKILFVSDSTGFVDLAMNPANPNEIYAASWRGERKPWTIISGAEEGGLWKTTDGGDTWTKLTNGLPRGLVGKIGIDIARSMPSRVYALVEAPGEAGGLYRSDDHGATWQLMTNEPRGLLDRPFYYTRITADPIDPDVVYVNNVTFWRSTDGGKTFHRRPTPHVDNHDLWIDPNDNRLMVQGNDGGANVSRDGGETWSTQLNQPTAELYNVDVDDRFPYWLYSGQQDNSSIAVPSLPPTSWNPDVMAAWWDQIGGCETGPVVPKPGDENVVYANCKGQFGLYDRRSGQERNYWVGAQYIYGHNPKDLKFRLQRTTPIEVSPHDPNTVYYGSQFLHRTRDGGVTWETISPDLTANESDKQVVSGAPITRDATGEEFYSTIYAIRESPVQPGVIWVGANDGPVHVTRDNGRTWTNVTPPMPPGGRIQNIDASPHDPAKAYVAAYRYLLDDWRPYIFRTTDYGRTWTLLTDGTNGIPADYPTRVVREDTERPGLLYAGTEFGIYVSFDDGAHWQSLQLNLPRVPVTDMQVHRGDLAIATMGRSFWVLDDLEPLRQATAQLARSREPHLYQPQPAYRMRYRGRMGDITEPQYIQPGAILDYVLPQKPDGAAIEIVNGSGEVLRRIESSAGNERTDQGQGSPWMRAPAAPFRAEQGHNRYVWDLTLPGPADAQGRPGRNGPMVVPGDYQVRLVVNGRVADTKPLRIEIDPRVAETGVTIAHLQEQLDLALRVRDMLSEARAVAARLTSERARHDDSSAAAQRLDALLARLETEGGLIRYPQPMLIDQINYLYNMINSADQKPGRDAHERYAELRAELDSLLSEMRGVIADAQE